MQRSRVSNAELESKSDPSLEEIASLAELRSKLKGRLRTVE